MVGGYEPLVAQQLQPNPSLIAALACSTLPRSRSRYLDGLERRSRAVRHCGRLVRHGRFSTVAIRG